MSVWLFIPCSWVSADADDADEALQEREEQLRAELTATQQRCTDIRQQLYHAKDLRYADQSAIDEDESDSDSDDDE